MKNTAQKLILLSFVLSLVAAGVFYLYLKSLKSPGKADKKINVLVAAETIPPRTLIDKKMIKEIEVPQSSVLNNYVADSSKIIGKYTNETVYKNEGFNAANLLDKNGNELSIKIDSNNRAISVRVTGESGVSDLIKPGDCVDIVTYIAEKKDGIKVESPDTAKITLQNIKVLAVDKQIERNNNSNSESSSKSSDAEKTQTNFLVTLSVPISDIEKLVLAESIGSIKLVLRPLKDNSITNTDGVTRDELNVETTGSVTDSKKDDSTVSSAKYKSYTVARGDTLKSISVKFYGIKEKYTVIKEANNIQDENLIVTGEVLKIPVQ